MIDTPVKKRRARKSTMIPQRKQLVLSFIEEFRRVRLISPTSAEICKGIGYSTNSEGQVHTYISQLLKEGWLRKAPGATSRALIPTKPGNVYAEIADDECKLILKRQRNLKILRRL